MTIHFTITAVGLCIAWTLFAALANVGVAFLRAQDGRDSWFLYLISGIALAAIGLAAAGVIA